MLAAADKTFPKEEAMPTGSVNADEMLRRIVRAVRRAGRRPKKVPCSRGGSHTRNVCVRKLRVNGRMYALHVLTNVDARRNRRVRYAKVTLWYETLKTADNHLYYVTQSNFAKLFIVPSEVLLRAFFMRSKLTRHSVYINLDRTPGQAFDFWQYENAW
jgi:hypothetical protein